MKLYRNFSCFFQFSMTLKSHCIWDVVEEFDLFLGYVERQFTLERYIGEQLAFDFCHKLEVGNVYTQLASHLHR